MRMPRFDRNPRSALARAQRSFVFRTAERTGAGLVAGDQTRTAIAADATIATIVVATENATDKIAKDIGGLSLPHRIVARQVISLHKPISVQFNGTRNHSWQRVATLVSAALTRTRDGDAR
jgi:hypothetical protein